MSADKESCTVILNKADCVNKVNKMIDEGIPSGEYVETADTTHTYLKRFQDFLYRHFKDKKCYDEMRPISKQTAWFFATAKTNRFKSLEEINVNQLKLRPLIDQTGNYIYNSSKVIAKYLKALAKNELTSAVFCCALGQLFKSQEKKTHHSYICAFLLIFNNF